jgi:AraC-like DNA-binding protein
MATVLVLHRESAARARLRRAVSLDRVEGARHRLEFVEDWPALHEKAALVHEATAVLDPLVGHVVAEGRIHTLARVIRPDAIVAYVDPAGCRLQEMFRLYALGVRSVITLGVDDDATGIRRALAATGAGATVDELHALLCRRLPDEAAGTVVRVYERSRDPMSSADVADLFGLGQRSMERRLERLALPPPHELVSWCRLLRAALLLGRGGRSVENVARTVGLTSDQTLRRMTRRMTALNPAALCTTSGFDRIVDALIRTCSADGAGGDERKRKGTKRVEWTMQRQGTRSDEERQTARRDDARGPPRGGYPLSDPTRRLREWLEDLRSTLRPDHEPDPIEPALATLRQAGGRAAVPVADQSPAAIESGLIALLMSMALPAEVRRNGAFALALLWWQGEHVDLDTLRRLPLDVQHEVIDVLLRKCDGRQLELALQLLEVRHDASRRNR